MYKCCAATGDYASVTKFPTLAMNTGVLRGKLPGFNLTLRKAITFINECAVYNLCLNRASPYKCSNNWHIFE